MVGAVVAGAVVVGTVVAASVVGRGTVTAAGFSGSRKAGRSTAKTTGSFLGGGGGISSSAWTGTDVILSSLRAWSNSDGC